MEVDVLDVEATTDNDGTSGTWFGKIQFIREFINGPKIKVFISLYMGLYGSGWVEGFKLRCFEASMTSCQKSLKIAKGPFLQ